LVFRIGRNLRSRRDLPGAPAAHLRHHGGHELHAQAYELRMWSMSGGRHVRSMPDLSRGLELLRFLQLQWRGTAELESKRA
jgi:hypothetical protein